MHRPILILELLVIDPIHLPQIPSPNGIPFKQGLRLPGNGPFFGFRHETLSLDWHFHDVLPDLAINPLITLLAGSSPAPGLSGSSICSIGLLSCWRSCCPFRSVSPISRIMTCFSAFPVVSSLLFLCLPFSLFLHLFCLDDSRMS